MRWNRQILGLAGIGVLTATVLVTTRKTTAQDAKPPKQEYPKFEEVTEGFETQPGLFTVYRKKNQLLLEIPEHQLGQVFLLAMSVAGGSTLSGHQTGDIPAAWERVDKKILLVEKEVHWKADERKPLGEVVKRTYSDHVRRVLNVVTQHGNNAVVDLIDLFGHGAGTFFGAFGANLDSSVVRISKMKSFPQNLEIALAMPSRRDGQMTTLFYSLSALPDPKADEYEPRKADDRIGYFLTAHKDFTDDRSSGDRFVRLIHRWQLKKADPALAVSPPKKPIVFYIEKTVPFRYRKAVSDGILEWNKAYEKCGFTGAVVVRQQTEDNEFKDFDPEDVRYNFFRWITSEQAFAMGPSRVNPYTGQILDADIIFDDSMARYYLRDYDFKIRTGPGKLYSPRMQELLAKNPSRYPFAHVPDGEKPSPSDLEIELQDLPGHDSRSDCQFGEGLTHELAFATLAGLLDLSPLPPGMPNAPPGKKEFPEEFINQVIKETVMHEVGHTLGLRHNFKASSWRPLSEINSKEAPEATSGSVMDYNAINVRPAKDVPQGKFAPATIGPYDYWAIEYGYKDGIQEADLHAIATRGEESGLAYATDEDTIGPDPLVNRWDLGADPLEFADQRMKIASTLWKDLVDRVVEKGEGYQDARRGFDMVLYDYQHAGMLASRFVGGEYLHRDHKGDPNERDPVVVVEAKKQRAALKFVCDRVFADENFKFGPDLVRKLAAGHWSHWNSEDWRQAATYPIFDRILTAQEWSLFQLTNPETLERLATHEAKVGEGEDSFTLAELFETLDGAIFSELSQQGGEFSLKKPFVSTIRRNLQLAYARTLIDVTLERDGPTPQLARTLVRWRLKALNEKIKTALGKKLDPYSAAHLDELSTRIAKALDASFTLNR